MASHAHSTRTSLLRQTTGSAGLLPASLPGGRIVAAGGPVTRALAVMAGIDPDLPRIRILRRSIADRIEADIALLDTLGGDSDFEPGTDDEPSLGSIGSTYGSDLYPQTVWARGTLDDRENPGCQDCDGEEVIATPFRLRAI